MSDCFADIPDEVLNCTWRDTDLARLAMHIVSWEELAPFLGLTEVEEEEIKTDNPKYAAQKVAALRQWKVKNQDAATYRQLVRVFSGLGEMELVEKVREIVLSPEEVPTGGPAGDVLSSYQEYLRKSCIQLPHPGMLTNQWPIINTPVYVQLPLSKFKKPRSQQPYLEQLPTGSSVFLHTFMRLQCERESDEPEELQVFLPELLSECSGGSILIKGLPGSGKTTLTWHASQQWAMKEEFQQFSLFLTIPLRYPRVQQATCLADLIPHPDQEYRKAVAQAISVRDGEGVCFWFDGWDEMPQEVQKESFIASFIQRDTPGSSLPRSTIVITTRPEALSLMISKEIWLNGLSVDQANDIIVKSVEGTDHNPSELIVNLERNTSLQAFCLTVPINVAIMVSLFFLFRSGLPNTQTELFECLVLNLILRNLQSRWKLGITSLRSFAALPDLPAESFRSICKIAFDGIMNGKTGFFRSDIHSLQTEQVLSHSTFGLMEIRPRMGWYGVEEELTFLHTTLQEFLATVYLTTLENEKQVRIIEKIVKSKSWYRNSVLQFYVGLIRLGNSEIFTAILQRCVKLNPLGLSFLCGDHEKPECLSSFVSFVNCIAEVQSGQLCQKLSQKLIQTQRRFRFSTSKEFDLCLTFKFTRFNTADFSNLGYFIGWFCQRNTCELKFEMCYVTPQQFKLFTDQIKQVCRLNDFHSPSLSLYYQANLLDLTLQREQVRALCGLIRDTNLVSQLPLVLSLHSPAAFTDYCEAMKSIVEAYARNSSCSDLILRYDLILLFSSMSTMLSVALYNEYYAVLLIIFCRHIKTAAFHDFFLPYYSYPLFACSLRYNTNIQQLNLSRNPVMCDMAIANIAQALSFNETVKIVIFGECLSSEELAVFLTHYFSQLPVRSGLEGVWVGYRATPGETENEIIRMINLLRLPSRRRLFQVIRHVDTDDYDCDGYSTSHYIVYTGFKTFVIDRNGNTSDAESDEHSDSDEDWDSCSELSDLYFDGSEAEEGTSDEHSDSDADWNSYFEFSDSYFDHSEAEDGGN